jgi:uncharacterized Zn finger protein
MTDIGSAFRESLLDEKRKVSQGKCKNCGGDLDVYEIDFKHGMRVLKCQICGLLHYYTKSFLGWKLWKATQVDLVRKQ